ncbi:helix-turn-helix transcriptional regulator [Sinorhizobium arboris]|uniref:helix-turn-helix transcriptional regulator n=1 Tax=Sinorhizobium arboris TaxID=76745 RepID=UPI000481D583|nr:AraC family transcriptional regulator [Sinorhizobium arboris]
MPHNNPSKLVSRFSGTDFEEMVDTFTRHFGPLEASPTGPSQKFQWNADFWSSGTTTLVAGQYLTGWQVRAEPEMAEWLSILLPREGAIDVTVGHRAFEGLPGKLLLVNNHQADRFVVRGAPHVSDVLRLDWTLIAKAVSGVLDVPLTGTLDLHPPIDLSSVEGKVMQNLLEAIVTGMRNDGPLLHAPVAMSNLTSALAELVVRSVPHRLSYLLDKNAAMIAPWHVHRAIDFMRANTDRPITMAAVAETVGVSIRALENGFRTFKETTPSAYLRAIRLRAAHADLLDPANQQSIKEISLKWGFFHFGRFSTAYREAYGEKPSDTKRRATSA